MSRGECLVHCLFDQSHALKRIIIIGGPNGAGKTTYANTLLRSEFETMRFINADHIASQISPGAPELAAIPAARRMIGDIDACVRCGRSFALESTLAGVSYLIRIPLWRALGYQVKICFLMLPNAEAAIARVAERVRQGGHSIPEPVIRRRFEAGLDNFSDRYRDLVDSWLLFDSWETPPRLMDWSES